MNKEKALKLADALEKEDKFLPKEDVFGFSNDKHEYADAIKYLRTGVIPENCKENELLYDCINDFETMCSTYDVY